MLVLGPTIFPLRTSIIRRAAIRNRRNPSKIEAFRYNFRTVEMYETWRFARFLVVFQIEKFAVSLNFKVSL